jgi:2-oxoglutarate ferredoxin oxidoreductase subunit alpha
MNKNGANCSLLHLSQIWPFPAEAVAAAIKKASRCYVVENNATGQMAGLIKQETGLTANGKILKYDGRPFTPAIIMRELKK